MAEEMDIRSITDPRMSLESAPATPGLQSGPEPGPQVLRLAAESRRRQAHRRESTYRRALVLADMLAVALALVASNALLGMDQLTMATVAVVPLFVLVCKAMGLYDRDRHLLHRTTLDEIPALFGISTLTALLLFLSDGLLVSGHLGRGQVLATWIVLFLLMTCFRGVARWLAGLMVPPERCVLVGDPARAEELSQKLALTHSAPAVLIGVVPAVTVSSNGDGSRASLLPDLAPVLALQGVERVILALRRGEGADELLYIIRELKSHGVKVSLLPEESRVAGSSVEVDHLYGMTLLGVKRFDISRSSRLIKRGFDLIGATLALVALAPFMAAVALAIKRGSPGPVLFRQLRAGRDGIPFVMFKFRTMVEGADERKDELRHLNEADGVFKIANDPRITPTGRWLRRAYLDELPQLFNVIRGEMSLVGPRPLPLDEDEKIHGWHRDRLHVRPGITGHWQVLGSARIPVNEMVKLDYLYVANWSVWNDIKLLLRTVPTALRRHGL
jgi:exopolysaccharide biosynthesis polyprenyl glycosylphosphotransferase